jgi:transcriptional regulator NrdR family protein
MKCPTCGCGTRVNETRKVDEFTLRRQRVCERGHRHYTFELLASAYRCAKVPARSATRAAQAQVERYTRQRAMWADVKRGLSVKAIAMNNGISAPRASRLLAKVREVAQHEGW